MSAEPITEKLPLRVQAGNRMSLLPCGGGSILSRHAEPVSESGLALGYPRRQEPEAEGGEFRINLWPIHGAAVDFYEVLPFANTKAYLKVETVPVAYAYGMGPTLYDHSHSEILSMTLMTVPWGTVPTRVNGTVAAATGAVTNGEYYFYIGKLFENGSAQGSGSGDGVEDIDYYISNLRGFGWPTTGPHFPPVDVV